MPTLAEQLVGSVLQSSQNAPDISGSIQKGAELGLHVQELQNQRAALEQKKQELQQAKLQKFGDDVAKIHEFKDGSARQGYVKFLKAQNAALGLKIPDEALDFAFAGPDNIARVGTLQTMVQDGTISGPDAISVLQDPSKFALIVPKSKYLDTFKGALPDADIQDSSDKIAKAYTERQANLAQAQRAGSYQTQAETRKDEQAAQAVERINNDEPLKNLSQNRRNISKGQALLNDPQHPPSWVTLNETAQDISQALSGKGTGSDFKLKEIKKESIAQHLGDLTTFATSNPDQPASPEAVAFWKHMADRLGIQYDNQISARATQKGREAGTAYAHNPNAVKAVQDTVKSYTTGTALGNEATYNVFGHRVSADQAKAFFKAHPDVKPDPQLKKDLGL